MLTPRFSCSQDDNSIVITIYAPSIRASEVEIHVDRTLFSLHVNPYFLRLTFASNVVEDDASGANYNPSEGVLTVTLSKETKGEHFADLDLLAKLLAPRSTEPNSRLPVEVLSSDDDLASRTRGLHLERDQFLEAEKHDWQHPQTIQAESISIKTSRPYGFLDLHSGYFQHVQHAENEVHELGTEAENMSIEERRRRREQHEDEKWDEEYYIADFANDEEIQEYINWKNPLILAASAQETITFSEDEKLTMLNLPRREYLIDSAQSRLLYLNLLSLLFAYCYDMRTTLSDPTPESAWTMSSLIPCFSALDTSPTSSVSQTLVVAYRRALAFPLYRSWALCEKCRRDVSALLRSDKRWVLRALLQMKAILDKHDAYYVYSKIWVDDYCTWIQAYANSETLRTLGQEVETITVLKSATGWHLEALEDATREVQPDSDDEDEQPDTTRPSLM